MRKGVWHRIRQTAARLRRTLRRHWRIVVLGIAIILLLEIIVQLVYPSDAVTPLGSASERVAEPAQYYQQQFADAQLVLEAHGETQTTTFAELGATLNIDAMLVATPGYPVWARLIPFSVLWHHSLADEYALSFQDQLLNDKAEQLADALTRDFVNAGIEINNSEVTISQATSGWTVDPQAVVDAIQTTAYAINMAEYTIPITGAEQPAEITTAAAQAAQSQARDFLSNTFIVHIPDHEDVTVPVEVLAGWIAFTKNDDGSLRVTANTETVLAYAEELDTKVGVKPGTTTVQYRDGQEVSRQDGTSGVGIDQDAFLTSVTEQIEHPTKESGQIHVTMITLQPIVKRHDTFSHTQAGLQAYISSQTADGSIKISVQQIGGAGWSASGGANDSFVSASTYKPYVMLRMFDDIDSGALSWSSTIDGMTMSQCLEKTIVVSANECAMALSKKYGGANLTNYLHRKGFSRGTGFTFSDATHTTAGDLTKYMVQLERGTLMSNDNRAKLLDAMRRQVYRQGIPAGTSAPVADKVGFLWDYLNDTAIVYHPQGTYVITVLTKGHSWAKIAEITRQVEAILYG